MKLKEINRTAIQSWSPSQQHPIYLATGTSAQQLDASFSTNASLELFELDLVDPSLDMKPRGSFSSTHRYHKLVWSSYGMEGQGHESGVLIAGGENGNVILYDPAKIMAGESDVIIAESERHQGPVRALDVNPFQTNLVASGGSESEIFIWDMNNFDSPMTPGPKNQQLEDVSCVSWNKQVQHILASASPSGRASVWDLRKNDLIIKVSDHSNRMHCSGLAWNPEVATQLVLASEDDRMPVIQMWDLRFATSPLKILESHTRGVLSIAWSLADPELLLSCGKDSRILCWNPNTAEVLYELPTGTQWCFDVQWCPRNPAVLSAACFDGHIDIYSIMGGSSQAQSQRRADQISNSFGNMDPFGTGQVLPPLQLPQTTAVPATVNPLKKPPKWIRRPLCASFAFGGKLVTLENCRPSPQQPQQPTAHLVHISQVVTETEFLNRSDRLQATLTGGSFVEFCQEKMDLAENDFDKTVWSFLKANFDSDVRSKFLELLGYNKEELAAKISTALEGKTTTPQGDLQPPVAAAPADLEVVHQSASPEDAFEMIAAANLQPAASLDLEPEEDLERDLNDSVDPITAEEEEEIPLEEDSPAEVEPSPAAAPVVGSEVAAAPAGGATLSVSQDVDGLITQALLTGDFEGAVELCLHDNRMADSIILAIAGGQELLERTQKKYLSQTRSKLTKLISAVVTKDWHDILKTCDLQSWKEALAAVMTYAQPEEFSSLCDLLGDRLEAADDVQLRLRACLCYICAGNIEKLVSCWTRAQDGRSPLSLQDLVEKVVVLRRAVEQTQCSSPATVGILLAEKMSQYAALLASQGSLSTAITYLPDNTNQVTVQQLRERLSRALNQQPVAAAPSRRAQPPAAPHHFTPVHPGMVPQPAAPAPSPASAPAPMQYYQPMRAAATVTSWSNQTPTALPNAPPAPPVGPGPDQQVDPPHPPHPGYGMTAAAVAAPPPSSNATYMLSQQYQPFSPVSQYPPGTAGAPFSYQHAQLSSSASPALPPAEPCAPAPPPGFLSQYTQPPVYQPVSLSSSPPSVAPFFPSSSAAAYVQQGGPGSPASYQPPGGASGPQNGWNDPPTLSRSLKKKQVTENYTPPAPITAPIMAPVGGDPPATMAQGQYPGTQQPYPTSAMNPGVPATGMEGAPGAPTGDLIQPLQSIPAEKITKKPIPEEHLVLKTTFEGLIQKCLAAAGDPQTKRKLDDATKRLEALYDKLREQALSPAIVGGLHNMARSIESRSYAEGLNIHTHIVSNSNFSETSAFMPVLKVVLTQANKLGV
ncbi:protein transport protein Sec31A isoform X3 [Synchiropus splendidus]|uniref:protein transport protein Sec31A isoform X3 n=1 Tax=Synchiropus splendidus TaxID=270530 RepID=UPI00237E7A56|nr:protein transport protein Sec31A isoform X3 [Synchiropus splendidus]